MKRFTFVFIAVLTALILTGCPGTGQDPVPEPYIEDYRGMVSVTGGTFNQKATSGTTDNFDHAISNFKMAKYEVTYDLWNEVYDWAVLPVNGYTFANSGTEGYDGTAGADPTVDKYEPVTTINWRDAIVWCNAYSEMSGYSPVYHTDAGYTLPLKTSTNSGTIDTTAGSEDNPYVNWSTNGYRLPTEGEWQYAASNKGGTPFNYASGATADYTDATETQKVAWYSVNSGSKTNTVGTTINSSALTLWDMSGNVGEWCWDWYGSYPGIQTNYKGPSSGSSRVLRGGSWSSNANYLQVGYRNNGIPNFEYYGLGFRLASGQ